MSVTATVRDQYGNPVAGVNLGFVFDRATRQRWHYRLTPCPARRPTPIWLPMALARRSSPGMRACGEYGVTLAYAFWDANNNDLQDAGETRAVQPWSLSLYSQRTAPTVTINQAGGQADPTSASPINFTVVFSEAVTGFATGDVTFTGSTAGGTLVGTVSGTGPTYNVAVSGMTTSGTVIATIAAGVAQDVDTNPNAASTSTDNTVTWDVTAPTVTINQAARPGRPDQHQPHQLHGGL